MDSGAFFDTLSISENGLYNLRFEQVRFASYLFKGANVQLSVDAKQSNSILNLSGDYEELKSYLYKSSYHAFIDSYKLKKKVNKKWRILNKKV